MPQMVSCPICASKLKVPDSAAGRKVKCPKCQNVIAVPADPEEPETFAQVTAEPPQPPPLRDRRVSSTRRRDVDDRDDDYDDDYDDRRPRRRARRQDRETQPEGTGLQLGLGVGSLSVGIVGLIFALIPCLGFFSWPLCAIGLVVGVVGLIIGISKGAGTGLPIAGTAVSGVALAISLLWVFVIARAVNQAGQQINVNMQQFAKEMQKAAEQAQADMQRQQKLQGQNPFNFPAAKAPAGPPTPVNGELTLVGGKGEIQAELTAADPRDRMRQQSPCKVYTLNMRSGIAYQIDMIKKDAGPRNRLDPFLRLEDPDGVHLTQDDDGGGNLNARIFFKCPRAGAYRIVTTALVGGEGAFTLRVQEDVKMPKQPFNIQGMNGPPTPASGPIDLQGGQGQIDGELTLADPKDRARIASPCKVYTVTMSAGRTYQIDMTSSKIDSFLRLEDPEGNQLAADDDGGGFPNARIVFLCARAGVYRIVATTFVGGTGPFTLKVQEK